MKSITHHLKRWGLVGDMSSVDYPKCFGHYVIQEYIGTGGRISESSALRCVIKQL